MIDITLPGTAALLPLPDRALATVFLTVCGSSILFDCGEGTQSAARKTDCNVLRTDIIALTHFHGDHIFGLPGLLQTMNCMDRQKPLTVLAPEGAGRELAPVLTLAGALCFDVRVMTIPDSGVLLRDVCPSFCENASLTPIVTNHRVISRGYRFDLARAGRFLPEKADGLGVPLKFRSLLQKGESVALADGRIVAPADVMTPKRKGLCVAVTGDTSPCETLTEGARGADLLICDATYGDSEQEPLALEHGHSTFTLAAKTAKDAGVKRLVLTHYSQMIRDPGEYLDNARAVFADTEAGFDGMKITLDFEE